MGRTFSRMGRAAAALVDRPRLRSLVNATEGGAVCVVSAAPGYGGSTLLKQVASGTRDQVVRLGPLDTDLWTATAEAIGLAPSRRRVPVAPRAVLDALVDGPARWLLADLPASADVEPELIRLAESLPAHVRLAVATHRDVLGGPTLSGRGIVVDERLLAFRPDEAVDLLPGVDVEVIEALLDLTEGWAAGLLGAATAARSGERNVVAWLRTRGVDRLLGSWFDALPVEQRDFLVATAALETLDVGGCNAVREADDSAALLRTLATSHAYVEEVVDDAAERTWRRHTLLTLFLRRVGEPGTALLRQHSRAADWYRSQGDRRRTMHHLLAAGRSADAGHYLREHETGLLIDGQAAATLDWYDRLPGDAHGTAALRLLRLGWGHLLSGNITEADTFLERLRVLGPGSGHDLEADLALEGESNAFAAYLAAFHGDAATMVVASERAVAAFDGAVERNAEQFAYIMLVKGLQWSGQHERAAQLLDLLESRPFPTDLIRESALASVRAARQLNEGRVHEAFRTADRAVRWLQDRGVDPVRARNTTAAGELAAALLERGDVEAGATLVQAVCDGHRDNRRFGDLVSVLVTRARLHRVLGDSGAALRDLHEAHSLLTQHAPGSPLHGLIDVAEARTRIDTGDAVRAERLIRRLPPGQERTLLSGRLALLRGTDPRRALAALDPATPRLAAEQHLLLASAKRGLGSRVAEAHLLRAAQIAVEHGQALLLVGATPDVIALAQDVARRHGEDGLARLAATAQQQPAATPAAAGPALTRGDLQLLAFLPTRHTVGQIAQQLGVTENTVKTRLQRLYRKLDAHSRDEAITRARSRGVLSR